MCSQSIYVQRLSLSLTSSLARLSSTTTATLCKKLFIQSHYSLTWPGYEDFLRRMPYHLLLQIMRPTFVFFLSRFVSADTIAEMSSHRPICLFIRPFVRSSIHLFSVWKSFLAHTDLPNWIYSQPFYKSIRRRCHGNCGRMEVRRSGGFNSF